MMLMLLSLVLPLEICCAGEAGGLAGISHSEAESCGLVRKVNMRTHEERGSRGIDKR